MRATQPQAIARAADILGMSVDDLAEALGAHIRPPPVGGADPIARAALFREMGARHFGSIVSKLARSMRLHEMLTRYQIGAWRRHDQYLDSDPHQAGSRLSDAWRFLRTYRVVPSARTIRKSWPPDVSVANSIPDGVSQQTEHHQCSDEPQS